MEIFESLMVIFTAVLTFATIALVCVTWILAKHTKSLADIEKQRDRIEPLIRLFEETPKRGYRKWRLNITNLAGKPIRNCWVLSNGKQLPWANKDEPYSKIIISSRGAANVMIPDEIQVKGTYIQIKDGENILLETKCEDIRK